MASEIIMPKGGNTVESCLILDWRVAAGDKISKGDILCEVETDKSTLEIEAEEEGTILHLYYKVGDDVPVLTPILILGEPGEDISRYTAQKSPPPSAAPEKSEPPAPISPADDHPAAVHHHDRGFIAASPRARNTAREKAVDLHQVRGSGPEGRILERDVSAVADAFPAISPAAHTEGWTSGHVGTGIGGRLHSGEQPLSGSLPQNSPPGTKKIPPGRLRKIIASRMMHSLQSTAQYTLHTSAPASALQHWRTRFKQGAPELQHITLGDMLLFAVSRVLPQFPELNAEFIQGTIYQHADVHLGFAVDSPQGLMVPVLHNSNAKSLSQISDASKALIRSCADGNIHPDDTTGATFTVSNLGALGIERFTPLINPPQVAILGICNIQLKPLQKDEKTIFEPHIGLSMTIDHQVVDGAPAARFLKEFCEFVGDFTPHDIE